MWQVTNSSASYLLDSAFADVQQAILQRLWERLNEQIGAGRPQTGAHQGNGTAQPLPPSIFDQMIEEAAQRHGVDDELVRAVIKTESNFNPNAVSHAGAKGLMQLMDGTAASLGVTNSFDVQQNIEGGVTYLAQQLRRFGGNVQMALAAYNAGPGAVIKHGGIPPIAETQTYVQRVLSYYDAGDSVDTTV